LDKKTKGILMKRYFLLFSAMALLSGCSLELRREHTLACPLDSQSLYRDTLYFGLSRPDGTAIALPEWQAFLADVVTPAFPAGFSVIDAQGQWLGKDGAIAQEPSRLLIVLHPPDVASNSSLERIAGAYRQRFAQESVLRETTAVCARF
jgi:Protein of unknown function (DUF3574)/Prokaryotic membrane lipoprotein lipid attachment site